MALLMSTGKSSSARWSSGETDLRRDWRSASVVYIAAAAAAAAAAALWPCLGPQEGLLERVIGLQWVRIRVTFGLKCAEQGFALRGVADVIGMHLSLMWCVGNV